MLTASQDILRAEGERYAERLRTVGALVEYIELEGVDHGYDVEDIDRAREVYTQIAGFITTAVTKPAPQKR